MTNEEIKNILRLHKMWLDGVYEGERADLRGADLRGADLRGANLSGADLISANLDFSVFPLWCGGLHIHIDNRQAIQLLYHLVSNVLFSKNTSQELKKMLSNPDLLKKANEFHRVQECGIINPYDYNASQEE